ncbi:hypothetical protein DPMN_179228 [Dreissena polymorpha]|uniref:Uncharacterized protein n=1 Tax=Dreissena polymorpha TaxID=45954 RepID=A0A9D4EGL0_DREPO|nr:hypothetical protein DPMN_179228 [Dreissena polymorpha]
MFSTNRKNARPCFSTIRNNILTHPKYHLDKSSKFHEDRTTKGVFRVLTRKNVPPPGYYFHEDRTINVASIVLRRFYYSLFGKIPAPCLPCFSTNQNHFFYLVQDIIETHFLTKFHDDQTINTNASPPGSHILLQQILLTKFHEDRTINVATLVLTRKSAQPPGAHVFFQPTGTIFGLVQDIVGTKRLTKFHDERTINVASISLFGKIPAPCLPCFSTNQNHFFYLVQDIIETHFLTKFHDDQTINTNALPPGSHVFQPTGTIFKPIQDIIATNLLTKYHEDRTINVATLVLTRKSAQPPGAHVFFQPTGTIFGLVQDIVGTKRLTKFHDERTINVASTIYSHIWKNAPSPGGHVFQPIGTIFELVQDIIPFSLP